MHVKSRVNSGENHCRELNNNEINSKNLEKC